MQKDDSLQT